MSSFRTSRVVLASAAPLVLVCCSTFSEATSPGGDDAGAGIDSGADGGSAGGCPPGQKSCAGGCVSVDDPAYGCSPTSCDRCSVPFANSIKCASGKCAVATCQPGRSDCDGAGSNGCEADLNTAATCGTCGVACGGAKPLCAPSGCTDACTGGLAQCGTSCVDLSTSASNCGTCGNVCPSNGNGVGACVANHCQVQCNAGFGTCNGVACAPLVTYYADLDGDGYGAGAAQEGCTIPKGFSAAGGDCFDAPNNVQAFNAHLGQTNYYAEGYLNASGQTSYDYDCSGDETTNATKGNCGQPGQLPSVCVQGYGPPPPVTTIRPGGNPPGVNLLCGTIATIVCSASMSNLCGTSTAPPMPCR